MKTLILALATALPQYHNDQTSLAKRVINLFNLENIVAQKTNNLYEKTQIKRRYSVLEDIEKNCEESRFFNQNFLKNIPTTQMRNQIYINEAPKLALKAAKLALEKWKRDPKEITHIISISCTGMMAPGIEFILQHKLGLNNNVKRIGINFMGCFGAFTGLSVASALAKESPNNRILIVCTELCSLHIQLSQDPEISIGNALFSDGSAAVIVGTDPREKENPLWLLEKSETYALENSQEKMTWKISDQGFIMKLSREIPIIIYQNIYSKILSFINNNKFCDYSWAIHPGGKSIIEAIEYACNLNKNQTKESWNVLENYGNMSSPTFLFVLNEIINNNKQNLPVIGIGFGPGLSLELILLGPIK